MWNMNTSSCPCEKMYTRKRAKEEEEKEDVYVVIVDGSEGQAEKKRRM